MLDYVAIFDALPTAYLVLSPDLTIVDANPAYLRSTCAARVSRARSNDASTLCSPVSPSSGLARKARNTGCPTSSSRRRPAGLQIAVRYQPAAQ